MPVAAACCGLAAIAGLGLWVAERNQLRALNQDRVQDAVTLDQAKLQIQDLTSRLNELAAAAQPRPVLASTRTESGRSRPAAAIRQRPPRPPAADPRLEKLQSQLAGTQKELASTREELSQDKEELDGRLNATRDDLNGSIARTHDEVAALQKRGEQNIYEFKLTQSKKMQRVGPLSLALRSTSVKHKTYDLTMMVEDNALDKKHVNLYEPVWITLSDGPVQLVVNHVDKKEIEGYVSEPKYKKSGLTAGSNPATEATPEPQLTTRDPGAARN